SAKPFFVAAMALLLSVGWNATIEPSRPGCFSVSVHVSPLSVERKIVAATSPYTAFVAARMVLPSGENEIRSTPFDQSGAAVAATCVHVMPLSTLLKMPAPRSRLPPAPPPVPASIRLVPVGLIANALTARLAMKSFTGDHASPAFVDFQMPPPGLFTHIVFGSDGSKRIVVMRPPTFPGPSQVHDVRLTPAPFGCADFIRCTCRSAAIRASGGMRPFSS